MSKLRVHMFSVSLDGFGAGTNQGLEHPLGVGGENMHGWIVETRSFEKLFGREGGETGVDDDAVARGVENIGAWILGRNMFGPIRGEWGESDWKGWWGEEPPYHTDVFVLTHHARPPLSMKGGTTFHFVTDGIHAALERARASAGARDVRLGGGVQSIRQYLQARLVDELHYAVAPVLLGRGEHLFTGLDLPALGYRCTRHQGSARACHVVLEKQ